MRKRFLALILAAIIPGTCYTKVRDVNKQHEVQWLNYTLPLPHEISIKKENIVSVNDIGIILSKNAGDIEKNAVAELTNFFKEKTGIVPSGNKFEIIIGTLDSNGKVCGIKTKNAERLKKLTNNNQAYLIQPIGNNKLVLAALKPKGIYYAVQTLRQLLTRKINKKSVTVPLVDIIDWPDMDQRGVWNIGYKTPGYIEWMSSLKLNFTHIPAGVVLRKGAKAQCSKLPMELIIKSRNCAFLLMPHFPHYDYLFRYGAAEIYPELIGKGDGARNPCFRWGGSFAHARCPCMATPLLKRLLTEWIESVAEQGSREFSLWLSERTPCQCECKICLKDGRKQFQKETQASVAAIMAAREKYPYLQGRIFFTMGYPELKDSYECLALLPPEVKAGRVYHRNKAFDDYAASGRWIATYEGPRIGPGYFPIRYKAAEIKNSIKEYYKAKYSAFYSLGKTVGPVNLEGHWQKVFSNYQYSALAEWTWNTNGRSLSQFAEAWATVNNVAPTTSFAEWVKIMNPIESFIVFWGRLQISSWIRAAGAIKNKKITPTWIKQLPNVKKMQQMIAECSKAILIAEKIKEKSVLLESKYIFQFLQTMIDFRDLYKLSVITPLQNDKIKKQLEKFNVSLKNLKEFHDKLMRTPEVNLEYGPKKCIAKHDNWTNSLDKAVNASVEAIIKK